jgi:hypothetical protein
MSFITYFEKEVPTVRDASKKITLEFRVDNETIQLFLGDNAVELDWNTADDFFSNFEQALARRFREKK